MEATLDQRLYKRVYEDFEPSVEWAHEEGCDTLLLHLPGFKKDQLRVQLLTAARTLKITGERPLGDQKWSRFQKEYSVPENCDPDEITAWFEGDILYIRQPKMITPAEQHNGGKPTTEPPKTTQEPPKEPPSQRGSQKHAADHHEEVSSMTSTTGKQENGKAKAPEKEDEARATNGKKSSSHVSSDSNGQNLKEKSDGLAETEKTSSATSEKHKKFGDSADDAAKMERVAPEKYEEAAGKAAATSTRSEKEEKLSDVTLQKYKLVASSQVMELKKKPRGLLNLVVAVLLALGLGFYVMNSIRYYGKSKEN